MEKRTSHTDRRFPSRGRTCRGGYTLVEAMLASVLLSVSVLAVSGAICASYAQDQYAADRRAALASGTQLLDEISALPLDASGTNPSIAKYANYSDEAAVENLNSVVGTSTSSGSSGSGKSATRVVSVERKSSLSGATSSTGDFAVVGVVVDNGEDKVKVKRLITSAEANPGQ